MKLSHFFIDRPIFAIVLSLLIVVGGGIALFALPISEYPGVVPPTVVVRGVYPGANPKVIAETVASPLEHQINGVEGLLYMYSQSTSDGVMTLTATFALGTDLDNAQVQIQNRVAQTLPRLPQEVQRIGVVTEKATPDFLMVVHLVSPDSRYDMLYLSNFAHLKVRDRLTRIAGVGNAQIFGAGEYSMRVWIDPDKLAARQMTATDVVHAIREQNLQVAAGVLGAPPAPTDTAFQLSINAQGRLNTEEEFENIVVRATPDGQITKLKDVGRVELGSSNYALRSLLDNQPAAAIGIFQRPGSNAIEASAEVRATDGDAEAVVSRRARLSHRLRPDDLRARVDRRGDRDAVHRHPAGGDRRAGLPADLARVDHPAGRGARLDHRHLCRDAGLSTSRSIRCRCSAWSSPSASSSTTRSWWSRTSSAISSSGCRRSRRRARRWMKCRRRSSPSRSCWSRCSCRRRSSAD